MNDAHFGEILTGITANCSNKFIRLLILIYIQTEGGSYLIDNTS